MSYNTYQNPNRNFGRSLAFSEYLNRITPDQKAKIVAAERAYMHEASNPVGRRAAAAIEFSDSFKSSSPRLDPTVVT
jgi:hypothetical protein